MAGGGGGGGNQQENGEPFTKLERSTDSAFSRETTAGANWIYVEFAEIKKICLFVSSSFFLLFLFFLLFSSFSFFKY